MSAAKLPDRAVRAQAAAEKFGKWDDGSQLKILQAGARRAATALKKAQTDFSAQLTEPERQALAVAAQAMSRLGGDFEVATRVAKKAYDKRCEDGKREADAMRDRVAAAHFGELAAGEVLALCHDLVAFGRKEGEAWFAGQHPGQKTYIDFSIHDLAAALQVHEFKPNAESMVLVQRRVVDIFTEMHGGGFSRFSLWTPSRRDFDAFRRERARVVPA